MAKRPRKSKAKKQTPKRDARGRFVKSKEKGSKGRRKVNAASPDKARGSKRGASKSPPKQVARRPFDPDSLLDRIIARLNEADYAVSSGQVRVIDRRYKGETDLWHIFEIDFQNAHELLSLVDTFELCRPVLSPHYKRETMLACQVVKIDNEGNAVETGGRPYLTFTQRFSDAFSQLPAAVERFDETGGKFGDYGAYVGIAIEVRAPIRYPRN